MYSGMDTLVAEYRDSLSRVRRVRRRLKDKAAAGDERAAVEASICSGMERSLLYALCMMRGRPFWREHREIPVGAWAELERLKRMAAAAEPADAWIEADEAEGQRDVLAVAWREILSDREMVCLLAYERGMSYGAIAEVLGVSRATVQSYVERARAKLEKAECVQLALWDDSPGLGA